MNRLLLIFTFLLLASCSSLSDKGQERKDLNSFYRDSGVTRYFLPEVPAWINFSEDARCFREGAVRFFNWNKNQKPLNIGQGLLHNLVKKNFLLL